MGREIMKLRDLSIVASQYSIKKLGLGKKTYAELRGKGIETLGQLNDGFENGSIREGKVSVVALQEIKGAIEHFACLFSTDRLNEISKFDKPIKSMFDISDIALHNFQYNNVWSVGDLVSKTRTEIQKIIKYDSTYYALINLMSKYNVPPTPENWNGKMWFERLKELEKIEQTRKNEGKTAKQMSLDVGDLAQEEVARARFQQLMSAPICELGLSARPINMLYRGWMADCIEDLVCLTEDDLWRCRNLGKKSVVEIKEKLESIDLSLRDESWGKEDWLEHLENNFVEHYVNSNNAEQLQQKPRVVKASDVSGLDIDKTKTDDASDLDINEIPEKYRKTYAIGAMEEVEREIAGMSGGLIASRIVENAMAETQIKPYSKVLADKPVLPKVKIPKSLIDNIGEEQLEEVDDGQKMENMSDEQLLEAVKKDISIIVKLDDDFIAKHRLELVALLMKNKTFTVEQKMVFFEKLDANKQSPLTQK